MINQFDKAVIGYWQRKAISLNNLEWLAEVVDLLIARNKGGYQYLTEILNLPADTDIDALQNHLRAMPTETTLLFDEPSRAQTNRADQNLVTETSAANIMEVSG